jgi:hypothetical protein
MVKSEYYRRQADLCLRLALAQHDQKTAISLVEFAEGLMTKAEDTAALKSMSPADVPGLAPKEATGASI